MPKKILTVDDSTFMREMLKDLIKSVESDAEIDEAANGEEALKKCAEKKYDLVLLDVVMDGVDGMEVLKQIGKDRKILVISAVGQTGMIKNAMDLGALDYIVKPFDEKAAKETLKKFLGE